MDSNDPALRAAVRRSLEIIGDAADPPRPFDALGVPSGSAGDEHAHRLRRGLAVTGALAAMSRSSAASSSCAARPTTALNGWGRHDPRRPNSGRPGNDRAAGARHGTGRHRTAHQSVDTTVVSTVPPTTSVEPGLTVEDVRAMQATALRALSGFTAAVTKTVFDPVSSEPTEETAQVTLLADRSLWVDRGLRGWGSYDPLTHIVRGAFAQPDGTEGYQEIVGQSDGSLPLSILVGHDPTQLAMATAGRSGPRELDRRDRDDVRRTTGVGDHGHPVVRHAMLRALQPGGPNHENRADRGQHDRPGDRDRDPEVDDEHRTEPEPQLSVLRDMRVVESMPTEFPGTFPDDAVVDRSGDPNAIAIGGLPGVQALADAIGIAIPVPTGPAGMTISTMQNDGMFSDPDGTNVPGRFHTIETASTDGFLTTAAVRVMFSAPVGDSPVPAGQTMVDGLYCRSATDDGVCDDTGFGNPTDVTVIESGALAGPHPHRWGRCPVWLDHRRSVPDRHQCTRRGDGARIANGFEMVQPS